MNVLLWLVSLIFTCQVLASGIAVVTVTHHNAVTVTYDPVAGKIIPPSSSVGDSVEGEEYGASDEMVSGKDSKDLDGKVNAKATASMVTRSKTASLRSTGLKSTGSTDATTDVNSAFRMSLPFAFGTFAAVVLAAIVF